MMQGFFMQTVDWSDCMDVQADFSLLWVHISEGTFSPIAMLIILDKKNPYLNT